MQEHINTWDQSAFMRKLNQAFHQTLTSEEYATIAVLGFYRLTGQVAFTNAGHLAPLWYHAAEKKWGWIKGSAPPAGTEAAGLPLGLIAGTIYRQRLLQLAPGDLLVLYTDGLAESLDRPDKEFGSARLLELARAIPVDSPAAAGQALLAAVDELRNGTLSADDETLVVLQFLAA